MLGGLIFTTIVVGGITIWLRKPENQELTSAAIKEVSQTLSINKDPYEKLQNPEDDQEIN